MMRQLPLSWKLSLSCAWLLCLVLACEPKPPGCLSDSDCGAAQQCIQGDCKAANDRCRPGEKRGCYTGKPETRGKGLCRDGSQTCTPAGTWDPACEGETLPKPEACDGKDNDCNDKVDDGIQATETCDGIDNDCDGKIDNIRNTDRGLTRPCYSGPAGTEGKGPCKGGIQLCEKGQWQSTCPGEQLPAIEICSNNKDDDCDGFIDNVDVGQPCTDPNRKGECAKGIQACGANGQKECQPTVQPSTETCNGKDDDCDGGIDNVPNTQDPLPGQPCPYTGPAGTEGKGACKAGTKACVNGQWSTTCVGQVEPSAELCDNLDNDCNGQIDENVSQKCYTGPTGTEGVGPCKGGTQICQAGKWGTCTAEVTPQEELCNNGKDEDCNGKIDDVGDLGAACLDPTRKGVCQQGVYICQGQQRVCQQRGQASTEVCDGLDNDCDGLIDNVKGKNEALTRSCYTGPAATKGKGECADGVQKCVLGVWQKLCEGERRPHLELCNKKDDNCDGKVDEAPACDTCVTNSTRPCFAGPLDVRGRGACRDGMETCVNSKWSGVCTGGQEPTDELCNGQDDNCDGLVDNQPGASDPLQQSCFTGDASKRNKGACLDGFQLCTSGQWGACTDQQLPEAEICDNKDNNCDGQIDEVPACQGKIRKFGESCSRSPGAPVSLQCEQGLACVQAGENSPDSFCYQLCTNDTECSANQDGRTECALLTQTEGICIYRAAEGGACDIERSRLCKANLFCDMNVRRCRGPSVAPTHGQCGGRTGQICDSNHLCSPQTPGSAYGYCLKRCTTNGDCPSGICLYFSAQDAACIPLGTQTEGKVCGRGDLGPTLDTSRYCAKDHFCARFSPINPDGVCYKVTGDCTTCASNQYCAVLGGGGIKVCADTCTNTCPSGQQCTQLAGGKICTPDQPNGVVPFAGLCGPQQLCQQGLNCLSSDPAGFTGFCSKLGCNTNSDCPTIPPGAECSTISANLKACIFPCTSNANCPTGLACASNLKACFAP